MPEWPEKGYPSAIYALCCKPYSGSQKIFDALALISEKDVLNSFNLSYESICLDLRNNMPKWPEKGYPSAIYVILLHVASHG